MKQNSKEKILFTLSQNKEKQYAIKDFIAICNVSRQAVSKAVNDLSKEGLITKYGRSPKVFFQYANNLDNNKIVISKEEAVNTEEQKHLLEFIEANFYNVSPVGEKQIGFYAFKDFCKKNKRDIFVTAREYLDIFKKYDKYKVNGFVDARNKVLEALKLEKENDTKMFLDEVYYLDFYSYPVFGKTKLGSQVFYSKNSQDEKFMLETFSQIKDKISNFIIANDIKSIAYIPPSIKRKTQFMNVLKSFLELNLPEVKLTKIRNEVVVQQKSLKKLSDRILNAKNTIFIDSKSDTNYENILLIDDAVGSGATFNEVAKKIKDNNISKKVYALALVGSANGFDVVNEV